MSDHHTIPDHVAARVARLINEAEDMRQQAADDIKQIYADLREELKGMGWVGSAVSAEVAALKGAIAEIRLDDEKKAKREEKGERIGDYVSMLSRARAREGRSYAEEKGKGKGEADVELVATVATGMQTEIGRKALLVAVDAMIEAGEAEIADQEQPETATQSDQPHEAVAFANAVVASDEEAAQDGVEANTPSTHSHSPALAAQAQQANTTDEAVKSSAASSVNPLCARPDTCQFAHSMASCSACAHAKSRAAA